MARPAPKPRKYEMMIVVAPTVTEDGLPAVVERVTGLIEDQEGAVETFTYESPWGHRRLAYPIQNFRDAFYVLYYFDMTPRGLQELDRELRLDEAIIRHLIVKFDPLTVRIVEGDDEDDADDEDTAEATTVEEAPAAATASVEQEATATDDGDAEAEDADSDGEEADADDDSAEADDAEEDSAADDGEDAGDDGEEASASDDESDGDDGEEEPASDDENDGDDGEEEEA